MSEHNQDQELELIRSIKDGDRNAGNILLLLYEDDILRRSWRIFKKYRKAFAGYKGLDDIAQDLRIFLMEKCLPNYDPQKNNSFAAWVSTGWNRYHIGGPGNVDTGVPQSLDAEIGDNTRLEDILQGTQNKREDHIDTLMDDLEDIYSHFQVTERNDKLAIQEFFMPTDNAYLRRRGLALVEMATPTPMETHVEQMQIRSSVKYRRAFLKRLAEMNIPIAN